MAKYDPNNVDTSTPLGWWAARGILGGTALVGAGIVMSDLRAGNIALNPIRKSSALETAERQYTKEMQATRLQEMFQRGSTQAYNQIVGLPREGRATIADLLSRRFGATDVAEQFGKFPIGRKAGLPSKGEKTWWQGLVQNREISEFVRGNATLMSNTPGGFSGYAGLEAFPIQKGLSPIQLNVRDQNETIYALAEHVFGTEPAGLAEARKVYYELGKTMEHLGSNEALLLLQNTSEGAVGSAIHIPYGRGLDIPLARLNGLVYQGENRNVAKVMATPEWAGNAMRGIYTDFESIPVHTAMMRSIRRVSQPTYSQVIKAVRESNNLLLYEGREYHGYQDPQEIIGLQAIDRRRRFVLPDYVLGPKGKYIKARWEGQDILNVVSTVAEATGENIAPKASNLAKRQLNIPGTALHGLFPGGLITSDVSSQFRSRGSTIDPFLQAGLPPGVVPGRYFGTLSRDIRDVPYLTTPMAEAAAAVAGQQVTAPRVITTNAKDLSRYWELLGPEWAAYKPGAEQALTSPMMGRYRLFSESGGIEISRLTKTLQENLSAPYNILGSQGEVLETIDIGEYLARPGGYKDLVTDIEISAIQHGIKPKDAMKELRQRLTLQPGSIIGHGPTGLPETSAKLGGYDVITGFKRTGKEEGMLQIVNLQTHGEAVKFFSSTGALKVTEKIAPNNLPINEIAFGARVEGNLVERMEALGLSREDFARIPSKDRAIMLDFLTGVSVNQRTGSVRMSKNYPASWGGRYLVKHPKGGYAVQGLKSTTSNMLNANAPYESFAMPALSPEANAILGDKLAGYRFPQRSLLQRFKREAHGVTMISGGAMKPIFGKGTGSVINSALGNEVGRLLAVNDHVQVNEMLQWRKDNSRRVGRARQIMYEGGFREFAPKRIGGVSNPEFLSRYAGREAEALSEGWITRHPSEAIVSAARELNIINQSEYSLLASGWGLGAKGGKGRFRMAAQEAGRRGIKFGREQFPTGFPSTWKPEQFEEAATVIRGKLEPLAEKIFENRPFHIEETYGGTLRALGGGERGTMSEFAFRELGMIAPTNFMDYLGTQAFSPRMETLKTMAAQHAIFEKDVNWSQIGKEVPWSEELHRDLETRFFGTEDPRIREQFFKDMGVPETGNLVVNLKRPMGAKGKQVTRAVIPRYAPKLMGMQPIGGEESISRMYEKAVHGLISRSAGTSFVEEADVEAVQFLKDVTQMQGENILGKARTSEIRGSLRLQAASMGEEAFIKQLYSGLPEDVVRAETNSMLIAREADLRQTYIDKGYFDINASQETIDAAMKEEAFERASRPLRYGADINEGTSTFNREIGYDVYKKDAGLEGMAETGVLFNREPTVGPSRVQVFQGRTAEDLALQKYLQDYRTAEGRAKILERAAGEGGPEQIGNRMYRWSRHDAQGMLDRGTIGLVGEWGRVASQVDQDADQVLAAFFSRKHASVGELELLKTEQQLRAMHREIGGKITKYGLADVPKIYEELDVFKKAHAGTTEWASHQYALLASQERYKDILKPEKSTYAMETWMQTWETINGQERARMSELGIARTRADVTEKFLEKGAIGRFTNALQASHIILGEDIRAGRVTARDFHDAMTASMVLQEGAAIKAKHGTAEGQLEAVQTIIKYLMNPGSNQRMRDEATAGIVGAASTLFKGKTEEEMASFKRGTARIVESSHRFLETSRAGVQEAAQRKNVESWFGMLFGPGPMDEVGEIIRQNMGGEGRLRTTGRVLDNMGETVKGVYRSLGKHKGLLLGGVGLAVGTGLLLGGHGEVRGSDTIDESAAAHGRGRTPLPSVPGIRTASITPGLQPSMNFMAKTEGGAWDSVAASIISPLRGNPNPTIITNVSDYRRHLNPNYISDELER